jgi:hypothetical protein
VGERFANVAHRQRFADRSLDESGNEAVGDDPALLFDADFGDGGRGLGAGGRKTRKAKCDMQNERDGAASIRSVQLALHFEF